jgi:hypothetical protein
VPSTPNANVSDRPNSLTVAPETVRSKVRPFVAFALALLGAAVLISLVPKNSRRSDPMSGFPPVMLWAWERPENLLFINPKQTGVAFLAKTLYLRNDSVIVRPRFQPLRVPPGTALVAVAHIESAWPHAALTSDQRLKASEAILDLRRLPGVGGIQIDFDARASERRFYQELLRDLRGSLDKRIKLGMTALASWCLYDDWLTHLPVDEIVPMLFRLGVDQRRVEDYLERHKDFRSSRCQTSLGISLDEPYPQLMSGRRTYIFNPKPWTETDLDKASKEIGQ